MAQTNKKPVTVAPSWYEGSKIPVMTDYLELDLKNIQG